MRAFELLEEVVIYHEHSPSSQRPRRRPTHMATAAKLQGDTAQQPGEPLLHIGDLRVRAPRIHPTPHKQFTHARARSSSLHLLWGVAAHAASGFPLKAHLADYALVRYLPITPADHVWPHR